MPAIVPNNVRNQSGGIEDVVPTLAVDQQGNYVAAGSGGGGGGGASTIADGADVALGAVADAVVAAGAAGTISAKLRRLTTDIGAVLTAVTGFLTTRGYGFDVVDGPTTTSGAYSAGDVVGGYRTVTLARANDEAFLLTGVQVIFKAAVQPNIRVILFGATPAATLADNAAYTLTAADALTVRRSLSSLVLGAAYATHGTPKTISLVPPLPVVMTPISGGRTIGYYLIDDSGVTLTSTTDVQIRFSGLGA